MGQSKQSRGGSGTPSGVWNRRTGIGPANPIRVRTKRLDEIDSDKIALAHWLLAKQIVSDETDTRMLDEAHTRAAADALADQASSASGRRGASPRAPKTRKSGVDLS